MRLVLIHKLPLDLTQQFLEERGPGGLALRARDQVLAHLDLEDDEPAFFAMDRDRVVGLVGQAIGLVIAHYQRFACFRMATVDGNLRLLDRVAFQWNLGVAAPKAARAAVLQGRLAFVPNLVSAYNP